MQCVLVLYFMSRPLKHFAKLLRDASSEGAQQQILNFNSSFCVLIMTFVACRTAVARCNKLMINLSYSINFRIDISEYVSVLVGRHASLTLSCHFISRLIDQVKSEISLEMSAAIFFRHDQQRSNSSTFFNS